jgi:hypothetical protein
MLSRTFRSSSAYPVPETTIKNPLLLDYTNPRQSKSKRATTKQTTVDLHHKKLLTDHWGALNPTSPPPFSNQHARPLVTIPSPSVQNLFMSHRPYRYDRYRVRNVTYRTVHTRLRSQNVPAPGNNTHALQPQPRFRVLPVSNSAPCVHTHSLSLSLS